MFIFTDLYVYTYNMFKIHFTPTLFPLMLICLQSGLLSLAFRTQSLQNFLKICCPKSQKIIFRDLTY